VVLRDFSHDGLEDGFAAISVIGLLVRTVAFRRLQLGEVTVSRRRTIKDGPVCEIVAKKQTKSSSASSVDTEGSGDCEDQE
jgi:hypothetical protein